MPRLIDIALLGPRLALFAGRTAAGLAPKAASAAGELIGGVLGNGSRPRDDVPATYPEPARGSGSASPQATQAPTTPADDSTRERGDGVRDDTASAGGDGRDGASGEEGDANAKPEVEIPEVRSTVPQAVGGGFPEPPGKDPGDISGDESPHHALSTPVGEPDPTEWPDPYDRREDPRDPPDPDGQPFGENPHPHVGSTSTSDPHPSADIEAPEANPPKRDRLDD